MKPYWFKNMPATWRARLMRVGFNLHPAFRATGGRVVYVSPDFHHIRIRLPLTRRTRNIVGSMYGASLFAVTDGPHPTMLMSALGPDHIVWDKSATIRYRKPAYRTLHVDFRLESGEIADIRKTLAREHETTRTYTVNLEDDDGVIYATVERTVYIADKQFYKQKITGDKACIAPTEGDLAP